MKSTVIILISILGTINLLAQDRYWVGKSTYINNFSTSEELEQWNVVENSGAGSLALSGNGSALLKMDDAAGHYAIRIFNETNGTANLLPLDKVNGLVEFEVMALTGGNQRSFLQVQEFNSDGNYLTEQTILTGLNTTGHFSVELSTITWNAATTQIRFMFGGENYSGQQGTIELNYFSYSNTNKDWSNSANWSTTSGGMGGASAPGSGNTAIFDNSFNGICFLDDATTVNQLIFNGYTGSIDLQENDLTVNYSLDLSSGNVTSSSGSGVLILNCPGDVIFDESLLNAKISGSASGVYFNESVFNNTVDITKTGNGTDISSGGNTFNTDVAITINNPSGAIRLADSNDDIFYGDVTFNQVSGTIEPAYNNNTIFNGNVIVNSSTPIVFGAGSGTISLEGDKNQFFDKTGTANPVVNNMVMNKTLNSLTLNTDIKVGSSLTFIYGTIVTEDSQLLEFTNDAISIGANDNSYVDGPVSKKGDDAFTFPIGNAGLYMPLAITAPELVNDTFIAQYFNKPQDFGVFKDASLLAINTNGYWDLNGTNAVNVILSWNSSMLSNLGIADALSLSVAHWNGTLWENLGNNGTTEATITSAVAADSFSPFILASVIENVLPIELDDFWVNNGSDNVKLTWTTSSEIDNDFFTIERSKTGIDFNPIGTVNGSGNSKKTKQYSYTDQTPYGGLSYYRLKQTDFNGESRYHKMISNTRYNEKMRLTAFPNPTADGKIFLNQEADVVVVDHLNNEVMSANGVDFIDLSHLSPGLYILTNQDNQKMRLAIK